VAKKAGSEGEALLPLERDFFYLAKTVEKMDKRLERYDENIRSLERELASLKVWVSIVSLIGPGIVVALILRGLGIR
jgi:uncharacterized protein YlxW (UPF0749 family)